METFMGLLIFQANAIQLVHIHTNLLIASLIYLSGDRTCSDLDDLWPSVSLRSRPPVYVLLRCVVTCELACASLIKSGA